MGSIIFVLIFCHIFTVALVDVHVRHDSDHTALNAQFQTVFFLALDVCDVKNGRDPSVRVFPKSY